MQKKTFNIKQLQLYYKQDNFHTKLSRMPFVVHKAKSNYTCKLILYQTFHALYFFSKVPSDNTVAAHKFQGY